MIQKKFGYSKREKKVFDNVVEKKKPKFQYESLDDPRYIQDRNELLREGGNGWWLEKERHRNGKSK